MMADFQQVQRAHLDGSFHIVDMLGMRVVHRQPVAGAEQQVLLHCQVAVHDVILHNQVDCGSYTNKFPYSSGM